MEKIVEALEKKVAAQEEEIKTLKEVNESLKTSTEAEVTSLKEEIASLKSENDSALSSLKKDVASLKSAGEDKPAEEKTSPKVVEIKHGKKVYEAPSHLRLSYRDKDGHTHKVTAEDLAKDEKLAAKFVGKIKSITEKKS